MSRALARIPMRSPSGGADIAGGCQRAACLIIAAVVVAYLALQPAYGESSTVTLRDGSVITGDVISMQDGVYTIQSPALGTMSIKQSDVVTVNQGSPSSGAASHQVDALKEQLTADPDTMRAIVALLENPEMQAALDDPTVRSALQSGNLDALLSNPKVVHLADDPRIQAITQKVAH